MRGQEAAQESRAARHVVQGEFRAVAMGSILEFADVAGVVEQRRHQRHDGALRAEALAAARRSFRSPTMRRAMASVMSSEC